MAKIKIRPLDDRIVVEPIDAEEMTAGGIVLPDSAQEKPQRGTVLAVGPGKLMDSGERGALAISVGDEVIYGKYAGTEIEVDGKRSQDSFARAISWPKFARQRLIRNCFSESAADRIRNTNEVKEAILWPKQMLFDRSRVAQRHASKALRNLPSAVAVTMGPTGRNVIIHKSFGGPTRHQRRRHGLQGSGTAEDRFENMGAKMVNEVASKTSDIAGDGTTTATVCWPARSSKKVSETSPPAAIPTAIRSAVSTKRPWQSLSRVSIKKMLAKPVKKNDDIAKLVPISANSDARDRRVAG